MEHLPSRGSDASKWIWSTFLALGLLWLVYFYGLFHLGLRVPMDKLWEPFIVVSTLSILLVPGLRWARKRDSIDGKHHKRLYIIATTYLTITLPIYLYYGAHLDVIEVSAAHALAVIIVIAVPLGSVLGYYMRKSLI